MVYNQIYSSFLPSLCCFIYVAQLVVVDFINFINLAQGINIWLWMKLVEEKCPKMQRGWDSPYWQVNLTELHGCSQHSWVRNGQFMVTSIAVARKSAFRVRACSLSLSFYKETQRGPDNICTCNALYRWHQVFLPQAGKESESFIMSRKHAFPLLQKTHYIDLQRLFTIINILEKNGH